VSGLEVGVQVMIEYRKPVLHRDENTERRKSASSTLS